MHGQVIFTGVGLGNNKYEFDMSWSSLYSSGNEYLFGYNDNESRNSQQTAFYQSSGNRIRYRAYTNSNYGTYTPIVGERHTYTFDYKNGSQSFSIDDIVNATSTNTGTYDSDINIPIFAYRYGEQLMSNCSYFKLYGLKIWTDDILVRDFIPKLEKPTNKPGLWDNVTSKFYVNDPVWGYGDFIPGPKIS